MGAIVETDNATKPGRAKSAEKAAAILEAASALFLERGLQGTSMDAVAKAAGVSKQTVYSHFAHKEALFRACIQGKIADYGFAEDAAAEDGDTPELLLRLARRFMALIFDPEVVAMHRLVAGEAATHPRIAALFYDAGPAATKRGVAAVLNTLTARGELAIRDIDYAAWQLANMAFGEFHMQLEFGLIDHVPDDRLDAHLRRVVADFLRLYGTPTQA
jgi:TetR/AcrR family transcriptional repressor of mexJK operon